MNKRLQTLRLRQIDQSLQQWREATLSPKPAAGWCQAIREALGMSATALGRRMGMMATLALVVVGALGSCVAPWLVAPGTPDPEIVYAWLTAFRFLLGAGVGGIYPMAAAMAAEAKAAVEDENGDDMEGLLRSSWAFFWQSVGACVPYLLALVLLLLIMNHYYHFSVGLLLEYLVVQGYVILDFHLLGLFFLQMNHYYYLFWD